MRFHFRNIPSYRAARPYKSNPLHKKINSLNIRNENSAFTCRDRKKFAEGREIIEKCDNSQSELCAQFSEPMNWRYRNKWLKSLFHGIVLSAYHKVDDHHD